VLISERDEILANLTGLLKAHKKVVKITKLPRRKWCLPVENTQWKFCLLSRRVGRAGGTVVRPSSCCVELCNEGTGKLRNFYANKLEL